MEKKYAAQSKPNSDLKKATSIYSKEKERNWKVSNAFMDELIFEKNWSNRVLLF